MTTVEPDPELYQAQGTDFFAIDDWLTDDERAVRDRVRTFVDEKLLPVVNTYWERAEFPRELVEPYAGLNVAGGSVRGYGCPGMSAVAEGLVTAELARGDGSFSTFNSVHSGLVASSIALLGDEEQKQRWLPEIAACTALGAFALTEPDHGSDVVRLGTRARRDGDEWVLDGRKRWIGNGSVADLVIVWARDEDGNVGGFVVDHQSGPVPGYEATVITGKTSNRALWQADITLDGVRLPADARLAGSRTFADTNLCLTKSRQAIAWEGLGHAVGAYEYALAYAKRREQFGKPIAAYQLVQDKLSHMLADIVGMQLTCMRMAQLQDQGRIEIQHAALAKLQTASSARRVVAMARDILGGNGILLDHHVARHHADMEAVYTYEGTDTVQSLIVGRAVTGHNAFA
ncbi:acyl-CoA dehydrogenase family protein [Pseudonocardia endophytica]|uniref:Glutaryl-CoA dehydrogenase n=1 Tax=Pseudonocardia endophytica TaxID=401976 RepID=A0A4R1HJ68_PSEEN|nr:acyl-CoA dehydrogenase family protein [Pseudonocardia endophytica]TCK22374.1 glutaryl-CoA dehydrogenase [Pseudonocardia endophytica]